MTPAAVREAAERLRGLARRTPVMTCEALDSLAGRRLWFKCENFQRTGAFKFRGAANSVALLDLGAAAQGVVTHSSGNHGQALALAARLRGMPSFVVMPRGAPASKRAAVEGYGARVTECGPTIAEREAVVAEVQARTGATLIPPYDHPDVIAGQGTATLELLEEAPGLDLIVTPVGGGGLISGTVLAARGARVIGAEPALADDAAASKRLGEVQPQRPPVTIADGLRGQLGLLTWPFIRDRVERIVTVSEEEIAGAMRLVWERMKIVIEPSAAVPVAAVLSAEFRGLHGGARVGIILSGGNVDLDALPW